MESQSEKLFQIELGLENWRNYYKDTKSKRITLSLEGKYIPSRKDIDYEEESIPLAKNPINAYQAIEYEKAIVSMQFTYKLCIAIEYMYRWALSDKLFFKTCRIAKVKPQHWDETVKKSKLMLINILTKEKELIIM